MLTLSSLICFSCRGRGLPFLIFDDDKRKPCLGRCNHTVCLKCVKEEDDGKCPICKEPGMFAEERVNYEGMRIIEERFRKDCVNSYRQWWNGTGVDVGKCSECHELADRLRICFTCDNSKRRPDRILMTDEVVEKVPYAGKNTVKSYRIDWDAPDPIVEFDSDESDEDENEDVVEPKKQTFYRLQKHIPSSIIQLSENLICSNCVIENHMGSEDKNHDVIKLTNVEHLVDDVKSATAHVAEHLLRGAIEQRLASTTCQLRKMRVLRMCEVLIHFAKIHVSPVFTRKEACEPRNRWHNAHHVDPSSVSKFFEGMKFENDDTIHRHPEICDAMIDSLAAHWEELKKEAEEPKKANEPCTCTRLWEQMKSNHFGNYVEKVYAQVVMNTDLDRFLSGCPLDFETSSKQRAEIQNALKLMEKSLEWKLHLLPTVYCWNQYNYGGCELFDRNEHKPLHCRKCNNSVCLNCVKSNAMLRCPHCGYSWNPEIYDSRPFWQRNKCNEKVLELLDFYKKNCVRVFENWWEQPDTGVDEGFCMNCYSYSEHLEVCVPCELAGTHGSLEEIENGRLVFRHKNIDHFLLRLQCAGCWERLFADWKHDMCNGVDELGNLAKDGWTRGCNHFNSRRYDSRRDGPCRRNDRVADLCIRHVLPLSKIGLSENVKKAVTAGIVLRILKAGLEEMEVKCKVRHLKLLKTQSVLASRTHSYFKQVLRRPPVKSALDTKREIESLLEKLKVDFEVLTKLEEQCNCQQIWSEGSLEVRREMERNAVHLTGGQEDSGANDQIFDVSKLFQTDFDTGIEKEEEPSTSSNPEDVPLNNDCRDINDYVKALEDRVKQLTQGVTNLKDLIVSNDPSKTKEDLETMAPNLPELKPFQLPK